jgi:hypothetical protein
MANHVIFMQPYYTSGENAQENYESAMTQAIGHARRWGQVLANLPGMLMITSLAAWSLVTTFTSLNDPV